MRILAIAEVFDMRAVASGGNRYTVVRLLRLADEPVTIAGLDALVDFRLAGLTRRPRDCAT